MKYVCRYCGALNDIPDGDAPSRHPCAKSPSHVPKASGDTSVAVGMIGGASLGGAIGGGPVGAILGGIIGGMIGYKARGVG